MKNKERNLGTPHKTYYTSSFMSNLGKAGVVMTILGMLFGLLMGAGLAVFSVIPGMLIMWGLGKRFEGMILLEMYHNCFVAHFHEPIVVEYHSIKKIVISRYVITFFLQKKGKEEKIQIGLTSFSKQGRQEALQFFNHRKGKIGFPSSAVIEDKRLSPKALIFVWSLFWIFLFSIGLANWGYQNRVKITKFWRVQTLLWKGECSKCDLQNIDLSEQDFSDFNANGANLQGANLSRSSLEDVTFKDSNLKNSNFKKSLLNNVNFSNANLYQASFRNVKFSNTNFTNANLVKAILNDTDLRAFDFRLLKLRETRLVGTTLDGMDLSEVSCHGCKFGYATIRNANLSKANFNQVNFHFTKITECNSKNIKLKKSDIQISDFSNSDFSNSDFSNSYLRGNNFINTKLLGANFTGVTLEKNNFTGADLSEATWVNGEKCLPKSIGHCILISESKE